MIKTLTIDAGIEKRIQGKQIDEVQYGMDSIHYTCAGSGIKIASLLKREGLATHAYVLCTYDHASFIRTYLNTQQIPFTLLETKGKGKTDLVFLENDEVKGNIKESGDISDEQVQLLTGVIQGQMHHDDVVVLAYQHSAIEVATCEQLYLALTKQSQVQVCDLHPKYWEMLRQHPVNVLVVDEEQCLQHANKKRMPLSAMMEYISHTLVPFAKIIIYVLADNDMLLFVEGHIYRVVCSVKTNQQTIHKEAIICGVIKCYCEDGDIKTLSEQCMAMSVLANLYEENTNREEDAVRFIKDKVNLYTL